MGNGKILLLFAVCISLVTLFFASSCIESGNKCAVPINDNFLTRFFIIEPASVFAFGGENLEVNEEFSDAIDSTVTEQAGGANFIGAIAVFLDPLKMIIQFLLFFTPLPFLVLMANIGLPTFMSMTIVIPIFMLWVGALVDFIRGGDF